MNYVHFMNSISQKNFKGMLANFEYLQAKEMSRSQRYRLGRPPMLEDAGKQEGGYIEEGRVDQRAIFGATGLSGVVQEGSYQPTPSGGLQTLSGEFVCVTCKRGPPHTKKYAKNQCQTCYKKTKKA